MADLHDDIRGKLGDVSGFEVGGKLGDVSGNETFEELLGAVTQDQRKETLHCLELRVNRLEHQIFAIARWLDVRVTGVTNEVAHNSDTLIALEDSIGQISNTLTNHEMRLTDLEPPPQPPAGGGAPTRRPGKGNE